MRFSELLRALPAELAPATPPPPEADPVVRGLAYDSRRVAPGDCFVALPGDATDGHRHLEEARRLGAVALVVRDPSAAAPLGLPFATLPDTRRALAFLASAFFGHPSRELSLIGVTGTNGKTSVTYLVESILTRQGRRTGVIGTVEIRYAGERYRTLHTTPESLDLQQVLRDMCTREVDAAVMEVSSHGVSASRVAGCRFEVGAWTNLTQDHLDYHGTMEEYRAAKTRLFSEHLTPSSTAVLNLDDPAAPVFRAAAERAGAAVLGVSVRGAPEAAVRVRDARVGLSGTRATLELPGGPVAVELPLVGTFNLENLAVAAGIALAFDAPAEAIAAGAAGCPQVPGRMERVAGASPEAPAVFVDYAHTPDAVDKLLASLRPLARGRLIAVFGCGGDRDRTKRPRMAEAVARYADRVIATSDNPRTEDPEAILDDLEPGLARLRRVAPEELAAAEGAFCRITDRREAIRLAIEVAEPGDTVVIAGKGHEDYQIVGRERIPFDDREEARRALVARFGS